MQMGAIVNRYGIGEAASMAVNAGADILIYRDMGKAADALKALQEDVRTKKIKNETLNTRVQSVTNTKKTNLKQYNPVYIPEIAKKVNQRTSQVFLQELSTKIQAAKKGS